MSTDLETLDDVTARATDHALSLVSPYTELVYVGRGDRLTTEQVDALASGDVEEWDRLTYESEWYEDAKRDGMEYECRDLIERAVKALGLADDWDVDDVIDHARVATDGMERLQDAVLEADTSDPWGELAWGSVFLRVAMTSASDPVFLPADVTPTEAVERLGLPAGDSVILAAVAECLPECGEGWYRPYLFGSVDVGGLHGLPWDGAVTLTGGAFLLEGEDGYGYECALPDGHRLTVPRHRLATDRGQVGYEWDGVCGLTEGSYPLTITPTKLA